MATQGLVRTTRPMAIDRDATRLFAAGPLEIGVENRIVNDDLVEEHLRRNGRESDGKAIEEDGGISLHVCDGATGDEYLRFDCFALRPHYHYITPISDAVAFRHVTFRFDEVAHGPMLPWAFGAIRTRIEPMLAEAGAPKIARTGPGSGGLLRDDVVRRVALRGRSLSDDAGFRRDRQVAP